MICIFAVVYRFTENISYASSLWLSAVTQFTVGYGDHIFREDIYITKTLLIIQFFCSFYLNVLESTDSTSWLSSIVSSKAAPANES